jgi:hypothetical protein
MIGLSSAKFDIFLPIAYPRWPPQGNLVYHWNLWEFHWKTFLWETTLPIHTKIKRLVEDHPVIISIMLQFHRLSSFWQEDLQSFNQSEHIIGPGDFRSAIIEMMTGLSSAKFDIFLPIAYPRWPPQGNLVYHWNLWEFHWKTFLWETTSAYQS